MLKFKKTLKAVVIATMILVSVFGVGFALNKEETEGILNKVYLGMTGNEVHELFGEPDYQASGMCWYGYNNVGTFNPAADFGYTDLKGQTNWDFIAKIGAQGKDWSMYDLVDTAIKQPYNNDLKDGEYGTAQHSLCLQSADKNGFTVDVLALYQVYRSDGDYDVKLIRSFTIASQLTFVKNKNNNYELSLYKELKSENSDWDIDFYEELFNNRCRETAMYFFVGANPSDGRYGIGAGTVAITNEAISSTETGLFEIEYFPGATLQIEEWNEGLSLYKPETWIIEYTDSSKNITVGKDGTDIIPITDDLIGIFNVNDNEYSIKFSKYIKP